MATLVWDKTGDRFFDSGIDRGVLYLTDGSGVVWNGLTSVSEKFGQSISPVYYDNVKINDLVTLSDFSASMKAFTYPDEFLEFEGMGRVRNGVRFGDQPFQTFCLSYRTTIGNDVSQELGHKIHIVYDLTALPSDMSYDTISDSTEALEFEWEITAVPTDLNGYRPTAHIILDTRYLDSGLLEDIEEMLYGSSTKDAQLLPIDELVDYILSFYRLKIVDKGDGTWSATTHTSLPELITIDAQQMFTITDANAKFLDADTYEISDTLDVSDIT
jgi:hypothetical protein